MSNTISTSIKNKGCVKMNNLKLPILFSILALFLGGCGITTSSTASGTGSLLRSDNSGLTWLPKSSIMSTARTSSFSAANIWTIAFDPSDHRAVYTGTSDSGMFYSYDSGESWQWVKALNRYFVRSIAIDPQYSCTILAAVDNKLYKSIDCARTFVQTYFDNDPLVTINSVVIDPKDGSKVYLATSRGEVIKSTDRASSWRTVNRFSSKIIKLFINPDNGNYLYAATVGDGLNVSSNGGVAWQSAKDSLKSFSEGTTFKDLAFSGENPARIYMATSYGLLKSDNHGKNWSKIELITPKDKATINALAIDPTTDLKIYYSTNTTFYSSDDGGKNWTTKALPIPRVGWTLKIDPKAPATIFMGMRDLVK
jgi:photosystem II stability/assembly factor-like uncharacterized protein